MQNQDSKMSITTNQQHQSSYVRSYLNQQGLHSERLQSIEQYPHTLCSNLSGQHNELSIQCPIHHPIQHILKALRIALRQKNYKGVEVLEGAMLIVRMTMLDRLSKLFLCRNPPKYLIKFQTRQYASTRVLTMKSLQQNPNMTEMKKILNYIQKSMPEPPTVQQQQYKQDIYSLQATSTYMFDKILLNDKYSIGKKMSLLLKHTCHNIKNTDNYKVSVPPPISVLSQMSEKKLDWIHSALNQISDDMLQGFNLSRKQLVQILGFCRKTVQQYYYSILIQQQVNKIKELNYNKLDSHKNEELYQEKQKRQMNQNEKDQKDERNKIPLTQKQFKKLKLCFSSVAILRQIFYIHHTFHLESQILQLSAQEKLDAMKSIQPIYADTLMEKINLLQSTQYRQQYRQYTEDIIV